VGENYLQVFEYLLYASKILKATVLESDSLIEIYKIIIYNSGIIELKISM